MWIIKIIKIKCFYSPWILEEHWCIYSCLQTPLGENWFKYVRREYATAVNFPCLITLGQAKFLEMPLWKWKVAFVYSSFNVCFYLLYLLLKFSVSPWRFVLSNKCPWIQAKISDIWQIVINIYYPCYLVAGGEGGAFIKMGWGGDVKKTVKKHHF